MRISPPILEHDDDVLDLVYDSNAEEEDFGNISEQVNEIQVLIIKMLQMSMKTWYQVTK